MRTRTVILSAAVLSASVVSSGSLPAADARGSMDATVELGRRLFFDPAVSASGRVACATCHQPDHGFASGNRVDEDDFRPTPRHAQTIVDLRGLRALHWDGQFASVEALVTSRLETTPFSGSYDGTPDGSLAEVDISGSSARQVLLAAGGGAAMPAAFRIAASGFVPGVAPFDGSTPAARLESAGRYADAFDAAFGPAQVTTANIARAIEAYVLSLTSTEGAFDRWKAHGQDDAVPAAAKRGYDLFVGRAGCAQCHLVTGDRPRFTDDAFHATGITAKGLRQRLDAGEDPAALATADTGRRLRTNLTEDDAAFKTPTLRDVATRAPYMHDGSLETLEAVVRYYAKGATPSRGLDHRIHAFEASDADVADLVAFLGTLSGDVRPGLATDAWEHRAAETTVRFVDAAEQPLAGIAVRLVPTGDALPAGRRSGADPVLVTDADGRIRFTPGATTHVRVELPVGMPAPDALFVPDTCRDATVEVPVAGAVHLDVIAAKDDRLPDVLRGAIGPEGRRVDVLQGLSNIVVPIVVPAVEFVRDGDPVVDGPRQTVRYVAWTRPGSLRSVTIPFALTAGRLDRAVSLNPLVRQTVRLVD